MIIKLTCQECRKPFEHQVITKFTNTKKYCSICSRLRKNSYFSSYVKKNKGWGNNKSVLKKDLEIVKLPKSTITWDEPNFGGY